MKEMKEKKKKVVSEATQRRRIQKMELVARLSGHVGIIKPSHVLNTPELKGLFHPNDEVAFHVLTIKVLQDGPMPFVTVDIFSDGRLITIDLSKLTLGKKLKSYLNALDVLPRGYFKLVKNIVSDKCIPSDIDIITDDMDEYYPTCKP